MDDQEYEEVRNVVAKAGVLNIGVVLDARLVDIVAEQTE